MAGRLEISFQPRRPFAEEVTAAIILAAGASTRMGVPKANLSFREGTFLTHLCDRLSAFCQPVIVVLGAHAPDIVRPPAAQVVVNQSWSAGQLSSLRSGLLALPPGVTAILYTLVDHPDPLPSTLESLLKSPGKIAVPTFHGRRGHPVKFAPELRKEFLDPTAATAKEVFRHHAAETHYVPVDDPGVTDDIDDSEALARFRERTGAA